VKPQNIKAHWVCFDCRKMFRKPPRVQQEPPACGYVCPECKQPMRDMGVYFEPPRRNATRRWAIMRLLAENDISFRSEGIKAYVQAFIFEGRRPNLNRVKERLEGYKNWRGSKGQQLLSRISKGKV
jgi:hypothetical protein